jgi:2-polyprenyl-6-methoxyphenol hydroxylase-like FAD-dependent oxidoreductase
MIHWGFETLSELLPADLWADIHTTFCNPASRDAKESEGIKFYNGHSGDLLFQAPPTVIKRVTRQKLRKHAAKGVDIRWSVTFDDLKVQDDGVKITFKDGSETTADFVIGADGPRSKVRQLLLGEEKSQLTKSDFVCGYTSAVLGQEKAETILKAHPVWAMVYHSMGVLAIGGTKI